MMGAGLRSVEIIGLCLITGSPARAASRTSGKRPAKLRARMKFQSYHRFLKLMPLRIRETEKRWHAAAKGLLWSMRVFGWGFRETEDLETQDTRKEGESCNAFSQRHSNSRRSSERNWMASRISLPVMFSFPARSARVRETFSIRSWARAEKFICSMACSR